MKGKTIKSILFIILSIALAGCTSANHNTNEQMNTANETVLAENLQLTKQSSLSDTKKEAQESTQTEDTKVINTLKGEVEIKTNPKRIADVSGVSDILYILGMTPVATADSDAYDYTRFPVYLEKELEGAKIVGYPMMDTVDMEGILSVEPDLIIMNPRQEKAYEQLKEIATTIVIEPNVNDWRQDMRMIAEIFNKTEIAEQYIADYDNRAKEIGEAIKTKNGSDTTYFSFLTGGESYYLFTGAAYGDILYNDMGLKAPEKLPEQDSITLPVATLEGLTEIDADYMIILASDADRKTLEDSAVFNSMRAVKDGHVIWLLQSPYFNQAYSTYGKSKLIDEMKEMLIK